MFKTLQALTWGFLLLGVVAIGRSVGRTREVELKVVVGKIESVSMDSAYTIFTVWDRKNPKKPIVSPRGRTMPGLRTYKVEGVHPEILVGQDVGLNLSCIRSWYGLNIKRCRLVSSY